MDLTELIYVMMKVYFSTFEKLKGRIIESIFFRKYDHKAYLKSLYITITFFNINITFTLHYDIFNTFNEKKKKNKQKKIYDQMIIKIIRK